MWLARRVDGSEQIDCYEIDSREVVFTHGERNPPDIRYREERVWRFGRPPKLNVRKDGYPMLTRPGYAAVGHSRESAIGQVFWAGRA
jgi:hypothetical protein